MSSTSKRDNSCKPLLPVREESLVVPGLSRIAVSTHDPLKPIFNQRPQPTLSHRTRLRHILGPVNGVIDTVNVEAVTVGGDGSPHNTCREKEGSRESTGVRY